MAKPNFDAAGIRTLSLTARIRPHFHSTTIPLNPLFSQNLKDEIFGQIFYFLEFDLMLKIIIFEKLSNK
jgi:hypothetical protein